ncbi:MAG: hypothetical protein QM500_00050 [Methylococcales bacterium]
MVFYYYQYNSFIKVTLYLSVFMFLGLSWLTFYNEVMYKGDFYPTLIFLFGFICGLLLLKLEITNKEGKNNITLKFLFFRLKNYKTNDMVFMELNGGLTCISLFERKNKLLILEGSPNDMLIIKNILSIHS